MIKAGIDQDAIAKMFSDATAKQGDVLRKGVSEATLRALQGRELTIANIKKVLNSVATAMGAGIGKSGASAPDIESMLAKAVAGMDEALLKAVEAHRRALQQFVDQGVSLQEKQLKSALTGLENMEAAFFTTLTKAVEGIGAAPLHGPWGNVMEAMRAKGSDTGGRAAQTVKDLLQQTGDAMRGNRAGTANAGRAMLDGYAALASGVLIGMSEGLQGAPSKEPPARAKKK